MVEFMSSRLSGYEGLGAGAAGGAAATSVSAGATTPGYQTPVKAGSKAAKSDAKVYSGGAAPGGSGAGSTAGMGLTVSAVQSYDTCYRKFSGDCKHGSNMTKCNSCKSAAIDLHNKEKSRDTSGKFVAMADARSDCESTVGVGGKDITAWGKSDLKKYIECAQGKDATSSEIDINALLNPQYAPTNQIVDQGAGAGGAPSTSLITKLLVPIGLGIVALLIVGGTVYFVKKSRVRKAVA